MDYQHKHINSPHRNSHTFLKATEKVGHDAWIANQKHGHNPLNAPVRFMNLNFISSRFKRKSKSTLCSFKLQQRTTNGWHGIIILLLVDDIAIINHTKSRELQISDVLKSYTRPPLKWLQYSTKHCKNQQPRRQWPDTKPPQNPSLVSQ